MLSATFYASLILFFTSMNCFPSEDIQTKNPLIPKLTTQSQPPSAQNAQTVAKPSPKQKKIQTQVKTNLFTLAKNGLIFFALHLLAELYK